LEINLIIRELLAKHNYISLPGLGSFIQKYEPARPSEVVDGFLAPKQSISFDSSRTFNDEAIVNYLCEKMGVSHSQANDILAEFVSKLQKDLDDGIDFVFENIGVLSKNNKGKLQFEQAKDFELAISTYGLKDLDVSKTSVKAKKQKATPITVQPASSKPLGHPARRKSASKIIAGISIVVAIVALTTTFILIPDLRFWEKFLIPSDSITESTTAPLEADTPNVSQTTSKQDSETVKEDSLNTKVDQTITENTVKKTALYYEEPKTLENKTFYLIVGSFSKIENAQKLTEKYTQRGFNPEIIQGNSMYRVSISKSNDKNLAVGEFNKFRNSYPDESIWLLEL